MCKITESGERNFVTFYIISLRKLNWCRHWRAKTKTRVNLPWSTTHLLTHLLLSVTKKCVLVISYFASASFIFPLHNMERKIESLKRRTIRAFRNFSAMRESKQRNPPPKIIKIHFLFTFRIYLFPLYKTVAWGFFPHLSTLPCIGGISRYCMYDVLYII